MGEALDAYEADLKARGGETTNATRVRHHLPPALATKTVSCSAPASCSVCATSSSAKSSRHRSIGGEGIQGRVDLAAKHDPRINNTSAWKIGLAGLPDASSARNTVLGEEQVRGLITAAYAEDLAFGLYTECGAVTGARPSSLARFTVDDLQMDRSDGPRLMMPSSRKGRGRKRINRHPVPIPPSLAAKLRQAAGAREKSAPLLLQSNGRDWKRGSPDYRWLFERAAARAGIDPETTFYSLRHTAITRELLAGVPVRVVASGHDTSTAMIEASYSHYISDHSDAIVRRTLFDTSSATSGQCRRVAGRAAPVKRRRAKPELLRGEWCSPTAALNYFAAERRQS